MADDLEAPDDADKLYAARGDEIPANRPYMQGDVFADVEIPGVDDGAGYAAVLVHPCAMRADGVTLAARLQVARVESGHAIPLDRWISANFKQMPLPEMVPGNGDPGYAVMFDLAGRVATIDLRAESRVACLSPYGISLLQQRQVHHLTRYIVPSEALHATCANVLAEAELLEEWMLAAEASGVGVEEASAAFHDLIRAPNAAGESLQDDLKHEAKRAGVRRAVLEAQSVRFG
jgi:hypothetical protein